MQFIRCQVTRYISPDPQPGWVEAVLTDADGMEWLFHDKPPIFTVEGAGPTDAYPLDGWLRCKIVDQPASEGRAVIQTIDCDSLGGENRFVVAPDSVVDR
jgi:hypothetical protein